MATLEDVLKLDSNSQVSNLKKSEAVAQDSNLEARQSTKTVPQSDSRRRYVSVDSDRRTRPPCQEAPVPCRS